MSFKKSGNCRESVVWLADGFAIISTRVALGFICFSDLKQPSQCLNPAFIYSFADDELQFILMLYTGTISRTNQKQLFEIINLTIELN